MSPNLLQDIELLGKKIEGALVAAFHAVEHEVPRVASFLVDIYGPQVVANAIATHKAAVEMYAQSGLAYAEADTKALVQSTIVAKFGLPPTAAQFIASGIHHLFTIGGDKLNGLIEAGAASAIAATGAVPAPPKQG